MSVLNCTYNHFTFTRRYSTTVFYVSTRVFVYCARSAHTCLYTYYLIDKGAAVTQPRDSIYMIHTQIAVRFLGEKIFTLKIEMVLSS